MEMQQDPEYQAQVLKMEAEFAVASWEALELGESPAIISNKLVRSCGDACGGRSHRFLW